MCLMWADRGVSVVEANKWERGENSSFVVGGARPNFLNAYLSLQAFKKLNNESAIVRLQYIIGMWTGKEQVFFVFLYLEKQLNS